VSTSSLHASECEGTKIGKKLAIKFGSGPVFDRKQNIAFRISEYHFFERVSEIIESENLTYSEDAGSGLSF
jgi:hypothetical protein